MIQAAIPSLLDSTKEHVSSVKKQLTTLAHDLVSPPSPLSLHPCACQGVRTPPPPPRRHCIHVLESQVYDLVVLKSQHCMPMQLSFHRK